MERIVKHSSNMQLLAPLVGTWRVTLRWSEDTHKVVGGPREVKAQAEITWLNGDILHYQIASSHWLIGADEDSQEYTVLYTDERRVSRVYRMSFVRGVWKIWRDNPNFRQRFKGRLLDNGRRIEASWEKGEDGKKTWVHDFDMIFVRSKRKR